MAACVRVQAESDSPSANRRSGLVAIGTLPMRDEQMSRLERWIAWVIAERPDPGQQQLLHRYAVWHVTRRLRARLGGVHATHSQVVAAQRNIKAAVVLLDWLTAHDLTLATAWQGDLKEWLAIAQATHRTDAGNFVRWARRHKLTSLDFAAIRWGGPTGVIDTETRMATSTLAAGRPSATTCTGPDGGAGTKPEPAGSTNEPAFASGQPIHEPDHEVLPRLMVLG
jgi:hypothetical protein